MKKKIIITVSIIVLVIAAVTAVGAFMLFGNAEKPGVEYDSNDVKDVIDNIGIKSEENEKGETIEQTVERLKSEGKKLGRDYTVEYSFRKNKA